MNLDAEKLQQQIARHGTVQQILNLAKVSRTFGHRYRGAVRWALAENKKITSRKSPENQHLRF